MNQPGLVRLAQLVSDDDRFLAAGFPRQDSRFLFRIRGGVVKENSLKYKVRPAAATCWDFAVAQMIDEGALAFARRRSIDAKCASDPTACVRFVNFVSASA